MTVLLHKAHGFMITAVRKKQFITYHKGQHFWVEPPPLPGGALKAPVYQLD